MLLTMKAGKLNCALDKMAPEAIVQVNGLSEPYTLTPGQQLTIP